MGRSTPNMVRATKCRAFTLIELFTMLAIIALLVTIMAPRSAESRARSKAARCTADMRSLAVALEAYRTDSGRYPMDAMWYSAMWNPSGPAWLQSQIDNYLLLQPLSTPVAYISAIPDSPYPNYSRGGYYIGKSAETWYTYSAQEWKALAVYFSPSWRDNSSTWSLTSTGPDRKDNFGAYLVFGEEVLNQQTMWGYFGCLYDPTNGLVSAGDIVRVGP
jgi:general secretion pathway protein G